VWWKWQISRNLKSVINALGRGPDAKRHGFDASSRDSVGERSPDLHHQSILSGAYIIWAVLKSFVTRTKNEAAGGAVVGFIFIYYFFFDVAWTPLLQVYPVEIFPYPICRQNQLSLVQGPTA
jgi:hypothetical protein